MDKFGFGYDCYRKLKKYKASRKDLFLNRDLYCLYIFRKASYYRNRNRFLSLFYKFKLAILFNKYDFNVPSNCCIGKGLYIGHNGPIIINHEAIIGNNCNIATGVTIGKENRGIREGAPVIGDNVWIGTNAVIVGKIVIGNNVLIAPNTYCNFDVPPNSIVIGNPGVIHPAKNATEKYVENEVKV